MTLFCHIKHFHVRVDWKVVRWVIAVVLGVVADIIQRSGIAIEYIIDTLAGELYAPI
jgi:hypothetical protein